MTNNCRGLALAAAVFLLPAGCARKTEVPEGFQGVVEYESRVVSFEVPGRVDRLNVRRGDVVKDGDVLATLDELLQRLTRDVRADELAAARADLALLRAGSRRGDIAAVAADVKAAEAAVELARKSAERSRALRASQAVPDAEVDRADAELERASYAKTSLEQHLSVAKQGARPQEITRAAARVEQATSALALEQERLARHALHAKGAGEIVDTHVKPGELAGVGTAAVTIADTQHPYVDVFVPQAQLTGVAVGVKAKVAVDAASAPFPGVVEYVAQQTEFTPKFLFSARERPHLVIRVRVRIDDPEKRLHSGVPAFAKLER